MSGDDQSFATFYFEFSDYLDVSFLVEKFGDGRPCEETAKDIVDSIMKLRKVPHRGPRIPNGPLQ
jgi:hypothetical protein